MALRAHFINRFGQPRWTVIHAQSMGGHVSIASLELYPQRRTFRQPDRAWLSRILLLGFGSVWALLAVVLLMLTAVGGWC